MSSENGLDPAFVAAYVAVGYLAGHREQALLGGLGVGWGAHPSVAGLSSHDKERRARSLAAELIKLAHALAEERLA